MTRKGHPWEEPPLLQGPAIPSSSTKPTPFHRPRCYGKIEERHANAEVRPGIEKVCREQGYDAAPVLCTPDELMGAARDD